MCLSTLRREAAPGDASAPGSRGIKAGDSLLGKGRPVVRDVVCQLTSGILLPRCLPSNSPMVARPHTAGSGSALT